MRCPPRLAQSGSGTAGPHDFYRESCLGIWPLGVTVTVASGGQPAPPVPEVPDPRELGTGLGEQVDAGDADVGDAVADELDDVVRAHEQDV